MLRSTIAMALAILAGAVLSIRARPAAADATSLSGPYVHGNLAVFVVHGPDRAAGKTFLTLDEALARKAVLVHETGNVNELAIECVDPAAEVFVQAGDIVKGGRQDRTVPRDMILTAALGRVPLPSFCVEHGRWSGRGGEAVDTFASSKNCLATRELKLAARLEGSQGAVWQRVAEAQQSLSASTGTVVNAAESPTSLELTLEQKALADSKKGYVDALAGALDARPDAIGYVFAIDGRLNSAEVYGSSALFRKLWPKLIEASAVEAVASAGVTRTAAPVDVEAAARFLAAAEAATASATERPTARTDVSIGEGEKTALFETRDAARPEGGWVHRSYFATDGVRRGAAMQTSGRASNAERRCAPVQTGGAQEEGRGQEGAQEGR